MHVVLSELQVERIRQSSVERVRAALVGRRRGEDVAVPSFAREIEQAVLQELQGQLLDAARYRAVKRRHADVLLARLLGRPDTPSDQVDRWMDQFADEAVAEMSLVEALRISSPSVAPGPDAARHQSDAHCSLPMIDFDLSCFEREATC